MKGVLRDPRPEFSKTNKKSRVKNIVSYFFGAMGATLALSERWDYVFSISQPSDDLSGSLGVSLGVRMVNTPNTSITSVTNLSRCWPLAATKSKLVTDAMRWFDKFSQSA